MPPKRKSKGNSVKAPRQKISRQDVGDSSLTSKVSDVTTGHNSNSDDTSATKSPSVKLLIKGKTPVDPECVEKVKTAHVYCANGVSFHFMLNQTNLQHNNNKYYMGQLLMEDTKIEYSVWFRWGRVGKTRQKALFPCGDNLQLAIKIFTKKFQDKTGNLWEEKHNFEKVSGLYDLIEQDFGDDTELANDVDDEKENSIEQSPSQLPAEVFKLITLICDIEAMELAMREMNYDARRAPLGKLTTTQIKAGYDALNTISKCMEELDNLKKPSIQVSPSTTQRVKRVPSCASVARKLREELLNSCNAFYTRVPHNFGMRVPPLIDTHDALKNELELMKALEDIEVAFNILHREKKTSMHPADRHYNGLKCDLKPMNEDDQLFEIIKRYIELTHAPTHSTYDLELVQVFECNKHGERECFKDYGRRYLLWHGSRLTNWMGILGRGLRIAPSEAPCTGYMFGKGIYFADCSSKSANYAYASKDRNVGLLALCEVSLGESVSLYNADSNAHQLPTGKQSVMGIGKNTPDPSSWVTLDDGVIVPCGEITDAKLSTPSSLLYNEYVVYDCEQVRLRYLVQVKFNYKY